MESFCVFAVGIGYVEGGVCLWASAIITRIFLSRKRGALPCRAAAILGILPANRRVGELKVVTA